MRAQTNAPDPDASTPLLTGRRERARSLTLATVPWFVACVLLVVAIVLGAQLRDASARSRYLEQCLRDDAHVPGVGANVKEPSVHVAAAGTSALAPAKVVPKGTRFARGWKMSADARARWNPHFAKYAEGAPEKDPAWKSVKAADLPKDWDWRNVSGKNYLAADRQQHLPTYCGGCWLFSTVHSLNDRISIARNASFPQVLLAQQVMLNCQDCGNCEDGGESFCVYGYMHEHGIPDDTCAPYTARTGKDCLRKGKIGTCKPECYCSNAEPNGDHYAISRYRRWYLSNYAYLPGMDYDAMKAEIYLRGPITCGMCATDKMVYEYAGGIYREKMKCEIDDFDHGVSVSGWGTDEKTGEEFWLIRNSWGTFWGEDGWFRIPIRGDNMGVGKQCVYGVVDVERSKDIPPTPLSKYYTPPKESL